MFRKNYLIGFFTVALFLVGGISAFAQTTAAIGGRIQLKGADGKLTPVAGATVEVFRTDIKSKFPSDTTDKKGQFSIAGLPLGAQFVISISGPGITPVIQPGIKAGMEKIDIDVEPGDGKKYTEQEVRDAIAAGSQQSTQSNELTAEQKKKKEEYDKLVAERTKQKEQIESQTARVKAALEAGNAAYNSKDYNTAVAKYEEGFQANPDYVGSAPILLNNKGTALRLRASVLFNENSNNKDPESKIAAMTKVRQDLADAAEAYNKAWTIMKTAPATDIQDPKTHELNKLNTLNGARDAFRVMAITKQIDPAKMEMIKGLIAEYLLIESDKVKKTEAQRILGDIYLAAGELDMAVVEYKKALEISPDDPDALVGIGLSMTSLGAVSKAEGNDAKAKEQYQEAINFLQKFIDVAPSTHKLVASVKESIEDIKSEQNVAPQKGKTPTNTKKKN
jgi:tetratricopeptide (TPR) repeat protein